MQSPVTWRGIFYVQTAFSSLFVLLGFLVLPKDQANRRYTKGLDWGGAFLSMSGIGLLTYGLAYVCACFTSLELTICHSDSASKGWASTQVIACTCTSVVLLVAFWYYEQWREGKNLSVLMPPSMWRQPGAKMTAVILMVFFAWRVRSSHR